MWWVSISPIISAILLVFSITFSTVQALKKKKRQVLFSPLKPVVVKPSQSLSHVHAYVLVLVYTFSSSHLDQYHLLTSPPVSRPPPPISTDTHTSTYIQHLRYPTHHSQSFLSLLLWCSKIWLQKPVFPILSHDSSPPHPSSGFYSLSFSNINLPKNHKLARRAFAPGMPSEISIFPA